MIIPTPSLFLITCGLMLLIIAMSMQQVESHLMFASDVYGQDFAPLARQQERTGSASNASTSFTMAQSAYAGSSQVDCPQPTVGSLIHDAPIAVIVVACGELVQCCAVPLYKD